RVLGAGLSIAMALGVAAIWFEPYRRARIFSFVNPWHDAQGAGFQIVQAMIGLGSGGIFGRGLGQSIEKANFLPEAHTDMIFAIIAEELQTLGVRVSFAGSPERVEARLVPEAGYEFDPFRSAGPPRQAGVGLARALATAAGAPAACVRILRRRRPNVVLGAGGYVS